jgi:2-iminobutanoate/2-iminopropanoate deaminase
MTTPPRSIDLPGLTHNAPIPLAARVGPLLCSSGIAGKDAATGLLPPEPADQVRHAFANLRSVLQAGGATLGDVARVTVYVKDNGTRDAINAEWLKCFPDPLDRPARHILVYELQHGMALQLEFLAFISQKG